MPFTADHEALRASIRTFVEAELRPHVDSWEEAGIFPRSVFERMGDLGLFGLRYPAEYGGQGGDYLCSIVLAEEMARAGSGGLGMAVSVQTEMATPPIFKFGTEEQKQRWLVPAIAGRAIVSLGISEPDAGSDVAGIRTRAEKVDGGWRVNGTKTWITSGTRCDVLVLVARTGAQEAGAGAITLFLVDSKTPGFKVERAIRKMGMHASDTATLSFTDMFLPDDTVLGEVDKGFQHLMWQLQGERLIGAAGGIAGARACFDYTLEYARQRQLFGRPLVGFQVSRHKLVDMLTDITITQRFVHDVADRWGAGEYCVTDISMAKLRAAQVCCRVADDCVQMLGGAGYSEDTPVSRHFRDSRLIRIGGGADEVMKEIIAKTALGL